ncbi:MAG: diguanylate cyclase [Candidatus Izimaplasma sp.]|nr:diguanylate cyclase [Candidatus Izimaplasma bacterium]
MFNEIIIVFVTNILLLLSLGVIYTLFSDITMEWWVKKIIMGFAVMIIGFIIMRNNFILKSGIVFDSRTVLISITGMFLGFIPTIMGVISLSIHRIIIGGVGLTAGLLWIFLGAFLGLTWRYTRLKNDSVKKISHIELFLVNLAIQTVMIIILLIFVNVLGSDTIKTITLPILLVFPIGGYLVSSFLLLLRQMHFDSLHIKNREKEYFDLFKLSNTINILIDYETEQITNVNNRAIEVYGYSKDEFLTLSLEDVSLTPKRKIKRIYEILNEEKHYKNKTKHVLKNGNVISVSYHASLAKFNNRKQIFVTIIDETKINQQQERLINTDKKLEATFMSVEEGIIIIDQNKQIDLINDSALSILDIDNIHEKNDISDILRIYATGRNLSFDDIIDDCLENNSTSKTELPYKLLRTTSEDIFIDFTISPLIINEINQGAVIIIRDVTLEKERIEKVNFISHHDYLTGLYNRYHFQTELERLDVERQLPISVIICDVNGLKLVNDTFGHLEGDNLIKEIASILKKATRSEDIVARWGGDEFTILLPQTPAKHTKIILERIDDLLNKSLYQPITPSIAIGYSTKTTSDEDISTTIEAAEMEMYEKKKADGKKMRLELIAKLRKHIDKNYPQLASHLNDTRDLIQRFANYLNLDSATINELTELSGLHDIGILSLYNNETLDDNNLFDYELTSDHAEVGYRLSSAIPEYNYLSTWILYHHENIDGSGFPEGKKADEIPFEARLMRIIDDYDLYQKKDASAIMRKMKKNADIKYDADLFKNFQAFIKKDNS